jgi:hypothetical protein
MKSTFHTLSLHRLTSCTHLYSASLLLVWFCRLLLLLRNSAHLYRCGTDTYHRKRVTCSLSSQSIGALDLCTENTSRDLYLLLCDVTAGTKKTLLQCCWPRMCFGRCLSMELHVTIIIQVCSSQSWHICILTASTACYWRYWQLLASVNTSRDYASELRKSDRLTGGVISNGCFQKYLYHYRRHRISYG